MSNSPKRQKLTTLQFDFDDTARRLSVRSPIVATRSLMKMTLALGFRLYHMYNLVTGIHQLCLG